MKNYTVFLESEEFGYEEFQAEGWKDAIRMIGDLHREAVEANADDGVERKVGILIAADEDDLDDEPDLMSDEEG